MILRSLLLSLAIFCSLSSVAQVKWTVMHNGRLILELSEQIQNGKTIIVSKEGKESRNIVTIKRSDLRVDGNFEVKVFAGDSGYKREIFVRAGKYYNAQSAQGNQLILSNIELSVLFSRNKKLSFYTYTHPSDPNIRARIRTIHLCTLILSK